MYPYRNLELLHIDTDVAASNKLTRRALLIQGSLTKDTKHFWQNTTHIWLNTIHIWSIYTYITHVHTSHPRTDAYRYRCISICIVFHKRATKCRSLLQKMTYKDKGSYESSQPPMMTKSRNRPIGEKIWCISICDCHPRTDGGAS